MAEQQQEKGTFWIRTLARSVASVGAATACLCGVAVMFSFSAKCIAMGIFLIIVGLLVLMLEATPCFLFLDIGKWIEDKQQYIRSWQKMVVYFGCSLPAMILCASLTSIIGSLGLMVAGMIYMVLTIGPKGSGGQSSGAAGVPYGRQVDEPALA